MCYSDIHTLHGNSPSYVRNNKSGLHNFTRIVLRVTADGGSMLNYRIIKINSMCIAGYSRVFKSLDTAKNNVLIPKFTRECCSKSWDKLMEIKSNNENQNNCLFGYRSNDFINIDKFNNEISCFNYTFGRMITKQEISGLNISDYSITNIPDGEWICFDCSDTTPAGPLSKKSQLRKLRQKKLLLRRLLQKHQLQQVYFQRNVPA